MSESYELDSPERVAVGTLGPVGEREFFLQVREGAVLVTLKVEKQHVAALAQYLGRILRELPRPSEVPSDESLELEDFVEPAFVVGALAVSYDEEADRVLLVAEEFPAGEPEMESSGEDDEDSGPLGSWPLPAGGGRAGRAGGRDDAGDADLSDDPGGSARIAITRAQAAAFAVRGARLVAAGRPPCPLCGYPLDPRGHVCPRTNGHRPPRT
jgi:uncharacterized repeat protein (TIGR03847 family)